MKKTTCRAALLLAALAGLVVSVAPAGAADAVVRIGYAAKSGDTRAEAARSIADALGAGGRISAELVPLDDPRALFRDLQNGRLDIALVDAWVLGEAVPSLGFLAIPFTFGVESRTARFFNNEGTGRLNEVIAPTGVRVVRWFRLESPVLLGGEPFETREAFRGASLSGLANPLSQRFAEAVGALFQPAEPDRLLHGSPGRKRAVIVPLSAIAADNAEPRGHSITELPGFTPYLAVCVATAKEAELDRATDGALADMIGSAVGRVEREAAAAAGDAQSQLLARGYPFHRFEENEAREARESLGGWQELSGDEVLVEAVRAANQPDMAF